jgi:hypothetical protein
MTTSACTSADVLAAIQVFHARRGRWPVAIDFRVANGLPPAHVVRALFGTIDTARREAGMPPDTFPKRGTAFERAWPWTQARQAELTRGGEEA